MSARNARRAAAAVLTAGALGAAGLAVAPAAQAASGVSFCFDWAGGRAYANKPVYLMKSVDGRSVRVRRTVTDSAGCGAFTATPTKTRVWVRAAYSKFTPSSRFWYAGNTEKALAGRGSADLGTGTVRLVRAISAVSTSPPE